MGQYSIKDIEEITSVKAHTIRIWEKRYNIVEPKRTDTNIRFYTDDDLKRLLIISTLKNHGKKISHLAEMSIDQMNSEIESLSLAANDVNMERLKIAMIDFDEVKFSEIFDQQLKKVGFEKAIIETIYPFFELVGNLWLSGNVNPAQEHFVSNLVRQKLYKHFDELPIGNGKHILVFLLEGEWHDLGILFYSVILKSFGFKITFLGQSCPKKDVSSTIDQLSPDFCLTAFISSEGLQSHQSELIDLSNSHKRVRFLLSGYLSENVDSSILPKNIQKISLVSDLKAL